MKKILLILSLLVVCAALEVPEDYQWATRGDGVAACKPDEGSGRVCSGVPQDIYEPETYCSL